MRRQWRTDVAPRLQPVMPGTVLFDQSSEEGRNSSAWEFHAKVPSFFRRCGEWSPG